MAGLTFGPPLDALLDRLYARSIGQNEELMSYFTKRAAEARSTGM